MPSDWTVQIERTCPECGGRGDIPPIETTSGRTRTVTSGGTCPACHGDGVESKSIGLKELREMLDAGS